MIIIIMMMIIIMIYLSESKTVELARHQRMKNISPKWANKIGYKTGKKGTKPSPNTKPGVALTGSPNITSHEITSNRFFITTCI